jgi:hypothetical protein
LADLLDRPVGYRRQPLDASGEVVAADKPL